MRRGSTLVVAPNWVGDTVMALPVIERLAATERRLLVLAKPHLGPLLALLDNVAGTVVRAADDGETIANIRASKCTEAVILPNSFRSAWLPYRAGVAERWGYRTNLRSALLTSAVRRATGKAGHQVGDYAALLAAMGVPGTPVWEPRLPLTEALGAQGRELLARAGLESTDRPLIGLFPGAEFGPSKRWPWRRFAELARRLRAEPAHPRLVLIAGPKETWLAVRIHEESGKVIPVVGPDLDLGKLAAALSGLDLLITNDSGPMHLAAAVGVPCLALFGPTNPVRTRPWGDHHAVLHSDRWCSPCFRRRCPLLHHGCMKDLDVDAVLGRARALLAGR